MRQGSATATCNLRAQGNHLCCPRVSFFSLLLFPLAAFSPSSPCFRYDIGICTALIKCCKCTGNLRYPRINTQQVHSLKVLIAVLIRDLFKKKINKVQLRLSFLLIFIFFSYFAFALNEKKSHTEVKIKMKMKPT